VLRGSNLRQREKIVYKYKPHVKLHVFIYKTVNIPIVNHKINPTVFIRKERNI